MATCAPAEVDVDRVLNGTSNLTVNWIGLDGKLNSTETPFYQMIHALQNADQLVHTYKTQVPTGGWLTPLINHA